MKKLCLLIALVALLKRFVGSRFLKELEIMVRSLNSTAKYECEVTHVC